jgi:hypothetical protein
MFSFADSTALKALKMGKKLSNRKKVPKNLQEPLVGTIYNVMERY